MDVLTSTDLFTRILKGNLGPRDLLLGLPSNEIKQNPTELQPNPAKSNQNQIRIKPNQNRNRIKIELKITPKSNLKQSEIHVKS